jgi:hypothetical protein
LSGWSEEIYRQSRVEFVLKFLTVEPVFSGIIAASLKLRFMRDDMAADSRHYSNAGLRNKMRDFFAVLGIVL